MKPRRHSTLAYLRRGIGAVIALAAIAGSLVAPRATHAAGLFVVNSSADTNVRDSALTLREAILVDTGVLTTGFTPAERGQLGGCVFSGSTITGGCGAGVADHITFKVPVVNLRTPLPYLSDKQTWVDGGSGLTRIDGSAMTPGNGLGISADGVMVSHLAIVNLPTDPTYDHADIYVHMGDRLRIAQNYLGTLPGAKTCIDTVKRNAEFGVWVSFAGGGSSAAGDGRAYIYGNTIGCHSRDGVLVEGSDFVYIGESPEGFDEGNYVGLNSASASLPNGENGIHLQSTYNDGVQYNLVRSNIVRNNGRNGLLIEGNGADTQIPTAFNRVIGNTFGSNGAAGVRLALKAAANQIGGAGTPATDDHNVIDRNSGDGVSLDDAYSNKIQANLIGINVAGTGAVANGMSGVHLQGGSSGNFVTRNIISGNRDAGVKLERALSNTINGNRIGTNMLGTAAVPNLHDGVLVAVASHDNLIGGATAGDGNLISGNGGNGVTIRDAGTKNNVVTFNQIGTNLSGRAAVPNTFNGVAVSNTPERNVIGVHTSSPPVPDPASHDRMQLISGNLRSGIAIVNARYTYVAGTTWVGFQHDGVSALPNGLYGVYISNSKNVGVSAHVAFNHRAGIALVGATATENLLVPLEAHHNNGLAIDLQNDGPTANDPGDPDSGPNTLLNFPEVSFGGRQMSGTTCPFCRVHIYKAINNPRASLGGGIYLLSVTADASGNWGVALPDGLTSADVTLIAQDPAGNTSEMSPRH